MIKLKDILTEELNKISLQTATDNKYFGPVYHGTSQQNIDIINRDGFKITTGHYGEIGISNGMTYQPFHNGIPAPAHFLGFGVYFTTVFAIAKMFAGGTAKKMQMYYLKIDNLETINFGSPNTMMKWWIANGYDPELAKQGLNGRKEATILLTNSLKSKFDAVWYKGKGMYKLLDGDQVCVYNTDNIFAIDKSLTLPGEIGSKVKAKVDIGPYITGNIVVPIGSKGIIVNKQKVTEHMIWASGSEYVYDIQFKPGGLIHGVLDNQIEFV